MGLPVARLVVGTNRNDILARFLAANDMSVRGRASPASSPSMDIQVSSNFERLLFELLDRDPDATAAAMRGFRADRPDAGSRRRLAPRPRHDGRASRSTTPARRREIRRVSRRRRRR